MKLHFANLSVKGAHGKESAGLLWHKGTPGSMRRIISFSSVSKSRGSAESKIICPNLRRHGGNSVSVTLTTSSLLTQGIEISSDADALNLKKQPFQLSNFSYSPYLS